MSASVAGLVPRPRPTTLAAVLGALAATVALPGGAAWAAALGVPMVALGCVLRRGQLFGAGVATQFGGVFLAAGIGATEWKVVVGGLGTFLAWEVGRYGRHLRGRVGRGARVERAEVAHVAAVGVVGVAAATGWLALRSLVPVLPPTVGNLLLAAGVLLVVALGDVL